MHTDMSTNTPDNKPIIENNSQIPEESRAKFHPNGTTRRFPGATVLYHLPANSPIYQAVVNHCYDKSKHKLLSNYVQLPESSLHVTLLDVAVYHESRIRTTGTVPFTDNQWEELQTTDMTRFRQKFLDIRGKLEKCLPVRMKVDTSRDRWPKIGRTLCVPVVPCNDGEVEKIETMRALLRNAFGMPDAAGAGAPVYRFHITGYYPLNTVDEEEYGDLQKNWMDWVGRIAEKVRVFDVVAAELCTFETMFRFDVKEVVRIGDSI